MTFERTIDQLCGLSDIPRMVMTGDEMQAADLSAEEGFLLSRIDGQTTLRELLHLSGFDEAKTKSLLLGLYHKGLVHFEKKADSPQGAVQPPQEGTQHFRQGGEVTRTQSQAPVPGAPTGFTDPFAVNEEEVEEVADLTTEECREINRVFARVTTAGDPYALLGIMRDASGREVKISHRKLALAFHPDQFFRKEIGSYRRKVEEIFKRTQKAYEMLSDAQIRQRVNESLSKPKAQPQPAEVDYAPPEIKMESAWARHYKQEMKERIAKARRHYVKAQEDFRAGRNSSAASNLKLAMTYDPWNKEYPVFYEQIKPAVNQAIHEDSMRRGRGHENMMQLQEALQEYQRAVQAIPNSWEANFRLGSVMLHHEETRHSAREHLQKAAKIQPDHVGILLALGDAYMGLDMPKNALRMYEKVKSLDRKNEVIEKRIKKVKGLL